MGARLGFADVLFSKLADVPPPVAPGRQGDRCIASPSWVHRLEPLRVVTTQVLHSRYPQPASAAPAAGGIPVGTSSASSCGGSQARSSREQLAIQLLNRLGAGLPDSASDQAVRRAYRQLVRESHPDLHPTADPDAREVQCRQLRAVIGAWDVFQGHAAAAA